MVPVTSLMFPVLVSAVFVFVASSVMHMALKYHNSDFQKLHDEEGVLNALRKSGTPAGDYLAPYAGSMEAMKTPEHQAKMAKGPIVSMTISAGGSWNMGTSLILWFIYSAVISFFAAYVSGAMLGPEAHYLAVFRVAGTVAFMGYAMALPQQSIWYKRSWATTGKSMVDGLVYALLTAGTFGWLWP